MKKTLSLPVRPDRGSFRTKADRMFHEDIAGSPGFFRILLKPNGRRDKRRFYASNSDGMFWTEFREIASEFTGENSAYGIAARIVANNARLRDRVVVVPA